MEDYRLEGDTYIIEGFDKLPVFSSFLPGLAGIKGIPLWVYYTNRGQGIDSFGIHNKNNAIMEFNPADTAYENTALKGFRTFIKCNGEYFEPFFPLQKDAERKLLINKNSIAFEEINRRYGLKIRVTYFVLPYESIGALVRRVTVQNISDKMQNIEMIDGLPKIIPYGIHNSSFKETSNLLKSWSEVRNLDHNVPYYTVRSSLNDSAEVSDVEGGYFYLAVHDGQILPVICDREVIFGYDTSMVCPASFMACSLKEVTEKKQCFYNKIPSGFTPVSFSLQPEENYDLDTMTGFASVPEQINEKLDKICAKGYFEEKERQAKALADELVKDVKTHTSKPVFDQYIEQCYLDNFLRGGYPFIFGRDNDKAVLHLFSRKHGDPERDYNFFTIDGEYYSQGNGNFRDVNQNRRNDLFFKKDVGDFNIKTFYQLIQIDGYNPLEVRPSSFTVKPELKDKAEKLLLEYTDDKSGNLMKVISRPFTPGKAAGCIERHHILVRCGEDEFIEKLLSCCDQNIEAGYGEGYWSDHWDYNLDLIENYLNIFPEKETKLLFGDCSYRFYDSPARVLPRSERYVINGKNDIRQYGSLVPDDEKQDREGFKKNGTNWLKTKNGEFVRTNLMVKLISLALNKFATLDCYGMGIEMEGGKPGWNDAMNGLPGLFGSGMSETFELKRLVSFIIQTVTGEETLLLPVEMNDFLKNVYGILKQSKEEGWDSFLYWDKVSSSREDFREKVRFRVEGSFAELSTQEIRMIFKEFAQKLEKGIQKAESFGKGIVPTYFIYRVTDYEPVFNDDGHPAVSRLGLPKAKVKAFEVQPLPPFLEGPAKMLAAIKNKEEAETLYKNVRKSGLYDQKLRMYKTSAPIDDISMECGRIKAFTPGWLERESIFLHMEYKYLLAILKAGLYDEFYEELPSTMVVFRDPKQYGRSILENSSFLASSVNPDASIHGRGYVARLSGTTTEAISIWIWMFIGEKIFTFEHGQLILHFEPKLPGWIFDENGDASFTLLSECRITYHNPQHKSTFGEAAVRVKSILIGDSGETVSGDCLIGQQAKDLREGKIHKIDISMG